MNKMLLISVYLNSLTLSIIINGIFPDYGMFLPFIFSVYSIYILYYRNKSKSLELWSIVCLPQIALLTGLIGQSFLIMYILFSACCIVNLLMWLVSYEKKYQVNILSV